MPRPTLAIEDCRVQHVPQVQLQFLDIGSADYDPGRPYPQRLLHQLPQADLPGALQPGLPGLHHRHLAVMVPGLNKFRAQAHNLEDLVSLGALTARAAAFRRAAVTAGLDVGVSGGTQAGKTTPLN